MLGKSSVALNLAVKAIVGKFSGKKICGESLRPLCNHLSVGRNTGSKSHSNGALDGKKELLVTGGKVMFL